MSCVIGHRGRPVRSPPTPSAGYHSDRGTTAPHAGPTGSRKRPTLRPARQSSSVSSGEWTVGLLAEDGHSFTPLAERAAGFSAASGWADRRPTRPAQQHGCCCPDTVLLLSVHHPLAAVRVRARQWSSCHLTDRLRVHARISWVRPRRSRGDGHAGTDFLRRFWPSSGLEALLLDARAACSEQRTHPRWTPNAS